MKLKNTLSLVIGSIVAATSIGALAQGQGAVEAEVFGKYYGTDSTRNYHDDAGGYYGGGLGYFLTDDVSLNLSGGFFDGMDSADADPVTGSDKNIEGDMASLDAVYHFGEPGIGLRPYVSVGAAHQSIGQVANSGRDHSTYANVGTGLKWYFTDNVFAKAGVDGMYNIDRGDSEYMAGVGLGLNFGGPEPVVAAVEEPAPVVEPTPENVRVELDVKFDFDKSQVKPESYADIQNLAEFMNQYPQTTTTVEGHTDSVGTDAYNQGLSERRASAVRDVLVDQYGVGADRVSSVGYGETRPVADNETEEGRAINRRVEAEVEAQVVR